LVKLKLGVSSCLLGEPVRYDGGHRRDPFLTDLLGPFVEWVAVCPEVEVGLPVPRPTLHLEGSRARPRMYVTESREEITAAMERFATERAQALARAGLRERER